MKRLQEFINESLGVKVEKWLKQVYDTMQQLIKDNKLQPIDVDVDNLAKPKNNQTFKFEDFSKDQIVKKIISDKVIGFTVINQMLQMPKKYLIDTNGTEEKELKPECLPYWYRPVTTKNEANEEETKASKDSIDPTYFVGIIMYDKNINYVDGFIHLVGIETSLCVKESTPVLKAMLNDWALHVINKDGNYNGITAKPLHPKMKANLTKLGFTSMKDNKEILTYKL